VYKEDQAQNYNPRRTSYIKKYTILPVTLFSINYNKTHTSGLKYEIKNLHKIVQETKKPKNWTFEVFRFLKQFSISVLKGGQFFAFENDMIRSLNVMILCRNTTSQIFWN